MAQQKRKTCFWVGVETMESWKLRHFSPVVLVLAGALDQASTSCFKMIIQGFNRPNQPNPTQPNSTHPTQPNSTIQRFVTPLLQQKRMALKTYHLHLVTLHPCGTSASKARLALRTAFERGLLASGPMSQKLKTLAVEAFGDLSKGLKHQRGRYIKQLACFLVKLSAELSALFFLISSYFRFAGYQPRLSLSEAGAGFGKRPLRLGPDVGRLDVAVFEEAK